MAGQHQDVVDLHMASIEQLKTLSGIGPVRAERILELRGSVQGLTMAGLVVASGKSAEYWLDLYKVGTVYFRLPDYLTRDFDEDLGGVEAVPILNELGVESESTLSADEPKERESQQVALQDYLQAQQVVNVSQRMAMDERRRADVLSRKVEVHYEQEERTRFEFEEMRAQFEGLKLENQNLKAEQDRSLSDTEPNVGVQTHTTTEYVEGVQTHSRNVQVKGSQVQGVQTHSRPDRTEGVQTHSNERVLERQENVAKRTDCKSEAVQNTGEAYTQYAYRQAERDHGHNHAGYAHGNENISNFQGGQPRGAF